MHDIETRERKENELTSNLENTKMKLQKQLFRVENVCDDDSKVRFYTGFITFSALMACFNFLGPTVDKLTYQSNNTNINLVKDERERLNLLNEFFSPTC